MYYFAAEGGLNVCDGLQGVLKLMGWDSVVRITSCYGLDGPGFESGWGRDFLHKSRLVVGPTLAPVQYVLGLLPGGKAVMVWH